MVRTQHAPEIQPQHQEANTGKKKKRPLDKENISRKKHNERLSETELLGKMTVT